MATTTLPDTEADTDTRTQRQPPYAVVLHNDDYNNFAFVVAVLQKVFGYAVEKCVKLMLEAHEKGRAVVWVGSLVSRVGSPVHFQTGKFGHNACN